ncbi:unnamed protein product [Leuciscus chuanchicus]
MCYGAILHLSTRGVVILASAEQGSASREMGARAGFVVIDTHARNKEQPPSAGRIARVSPSSSSLSHRSTAGASGRRSAAHEISGIGEREDSSYPITRAGQAFALFTNRTQDL